MEDYDLSAEEYIDIADKVRSGEYFREAREMEDIDIHDPMAERYWYLLVTFMAVITVAVAVVAWSGFYPLYPRVPFVFSTDNVIEDIPRLKSLVAYHNEDPNVALRRFLVQNYVKTREEYDATIFDRSHNVVESLSTTQVLKEYDNFISPQNPQGPIALYQRHTRKLVNITGSEVINLEKSAQEGSNNYRMRVFYDSILIRGETESPATKHQVDIAFQYKDIKLNENTGKITPYGFLVTSYEHKDL